MDCNAKTLDIMGDLSNHYEKPSADGTKTYGIIIKLKHINAFEPHKALLDVVFYADWDAPAEYVVVFGPGQKKTYTDPDGVNWEVRVDSTTYSAGGGTADTQICFGEANGEPEPTEPMKTPWALLAAGVIGLYLLLRRK